MESAANIIAQLKSRHELTDQAIADEVKSTQPTIWRIRTGANDSTASMYIKLVQMLERLDADVHAATHATGSADCNSAGLGEPIETERRAA